MEDGFVSSGDRTRRQYQVEELNTAHRHPVLLGLDNGLLSTDSSFPPAELSELSDIGPQVRGQAVTIQFGYYPNGQINPSNSRVSDGTAGAFQGPPSANGTLDPNLAYQPPGGRSMEGVSTTLQRQSLPQITGGISLPDLQAPWSSYETRNTGPTSIELSQMGVCNNTNINARHTGYMLPRSQYSDYSSYPRSQGSTTTGSSNIPTVVYCEIIGCSASFRGEYRQGNFKRHLRVIHGETVYQCEGCEKKYHRSDARLKHYRRQHPQLVNKH